MNLYFGAGVKTYWVVIPTFQTIHIITPDRQYSTFTKGIAKDPVLGIEVDMGRCSDKFSKHRLHQRTKI